LAALTDIPEYSSRIRYLKSIETAAEHSLTHAMGKKLFGTTVSISASRFEDYRKCPFMYFCRKGLKLYPPEKVELDKPSKGTALHYCLSEILKSNSKDAFIQLDRTQLNKQVKIHLNEYYDGEAVGGNYGKTERYKAAYRRLSDTLTDILVRLADEFKQCRFVPSEFEYKIGRDGSEKALELVTPNGINIRFEGSVDRIDVYENEGKTYVRVIDYKSGAKDFSFDDLLYGINMQMLLYLFAITDSGSNGKYRNAIPSGVLYMPAKDARAELGRDDNISDESKRMKAYNATYKMKGTVLCENGENDIVVNAMEKEHNGEYIPIKFKKDGDFDRSAKPVTLKELENLRKYSYRLMAETIDVMTDGHIEASPLRSGQNVPCSYCEYKSICGSYPPLSPRTYDDNTEDKIKEIMEGGDK
ncbi:MAG: PD-(D/E)XK nuclease family protein, partial [Oscillospiraceae bacterium]|nr:PD-(D/E)XK nuclease family protein [Oscillospiraceae bacterium]